MIFPCLGDIKLLTIIQFKMNSLYIPRIKKQYSVNDISRIFNDALIGNVKRVDFVECTIDDSSFHSAFVHLYHYFDTEIGIDISSFANQNRTYRFYLSNNEYWLLLQNKNPVPETKMNIHQVVENARLLEQRVAEQEEIIRTQSKQIERIQETIYQMLGRTFDQDTEMDTIYVHFNYMMYGKMHDKGWLDDDCSRDSHSS